MVTLVCGPPCGGKTTWTQRHAGPGDLVLDQDLIGPRAMRDGLRRVKAMTTGTAWVVQPCPGPMSRATLAADLRATRVVLLVPDVATLLARARRRPRPAGAIAAVLGWLEAEGKQPPLPEPRTQW